MRPSSERCARTDAVLAVHLDGDYRADELAPTRGEPAGSDPAGSDNGSGWDFVCGPSLQEHLSACAICQRALQRARRLDAALAADAGRALAEVVNRGADGSTASFDDFGRRLCERAVLRAAVEAPLVDGEPEHEPSPLRTSRSPAPARLTSATPTSATLTSRGITWLAATLLGAAAMAACWLLFGEHAGSAAPSSAKATATTEAATTSAGGRDAGPTGATRPNGTAATGPAPRHAGETAFPLEAARRFARARERSDASEPGPTAEQLAAIVTDRDASCADRITAGAQLAQLSRTPSRTARSCTDALLRALAACGDTEVELEVQRTLLPQLRNAPLVNVLVQRLHPLLTDEVDLSAAHEATTAGADSSGTAPDLDATAALIVALRAGGDRLDPALRRVLRTRADLDAIVTQALRSPTREDGGAHFLLTCWQDRVATGRQDDTPAAALHWFTGMPPATFAAVRDVLETSRSAPERVRCLLALGCVGDDSTTPCLLANLRSGHRLEACAASAALSTLPHSALRPLVPLARRGNVRRGESRASEDALLRLALCRAGLDEAAPWLAALELSERQREQLRDAPLSRFAEISGWFREGAAIAD